MPSERELSLKLLASGETSFDSLLGIGSVCRACKKSEIQDHLARRGAHIFQHFLCACRAQETGNEIFSYLACGEVRYSPIENCGSKIRMRNSQPTGFAEDDRSDKLHPLRYECLGTSETDDQEFFCLEASGRRLDQERFAELPTK